MISKIIHKRGAVFYSGTSFMYSYRMSDDILCFACDFLKFFQ